MTINLKKILTIFPLVIIIFFWSNLGLCITDDSYIADEKELITAYIERFTRFIEWPPESEIDIKSKPFVICIMGKSPFGNFLEKTYSSIKIKDKPVKIIYSSDLNEIPFSHITFICDDMCGSFGLIRKLIGHKPVLLISDEPGMAQKGIHINLFREKKKIRFEINQKTIETSGLYISHLLLRHGIIINSGDK